ncbi:MAG: glycosyltransferase family 2 protein, partial [Rhodospirillaceae bacterium]
MTDQRAESPDVSPDVSIVICTYNRRDHVGRTARSAIEDTKATRPDLTIEIIIADNGPEAYGSAVAEEIAQQTGTKVRAVRSSPPNISIARNAGVAASTAPLVAFLDDDLLVDPGWLDGLVTTLQDTGADAVIGPVRPSFLAGSAPDWDPKAEAFTRVFDAADGTRIHVGGPDRTKDFTVSTASSLWHRARCFIDPEPFLPIFGVCGGEDYDLFLRLENRGRRVHWAARGGVRETVPDTRISLGYRFLRGFSGGQV